jgi:hypothetical protein
MYCTVSGKRNGDRSAEVIDEIALIGRAAVHSAATHARNPSPV